MKKDPNVTLGLSLLLMLCGVSGYFLAGDSRPTGRWSIVLGPIFDQFGRVGVSAVVVACGLVGLVIYFIQRGEK